MTQEKYDKIMQYLDLLRKENISTYNIDSVSLFNLWCYGTDIFDMLSEEQKEKIEHNKIKIINDFEWLNLKIDVNEDDLMLFIIFTTLSNRNIAEFNKWDIANWLEITSYSNGELDKESIKEIIEEINKFKVGE